MARMIPDYYEKDLKSRGEKEIFEQFRDSKGTEDWVILHSLGISRHVKKVYGEIDFVVLAPKLGVFCLEVKAGEVKRENGVWIFTNKNGKMFKKVEGPFEQAKSGMFSLQKSIVRRFGKYGRLGNLLFGYGVMFTDIEFTATGPDMEQWMVYDARDRMKPITEYILRLHQETKKQLEQNGITRILPSKKDVGQLVSFLRKDFDFVVPFWLKEQLAEKDIIRLTEEQYGCLDGMQFNNRILFEGGAGTGKTMLAMESARRSALKGEKVLFLCYNNLLADDLKKRLKNYSLVKVSTFHGFLIKLCKGEQLNDKDENFFSEKLPEKAFEILVENSFDSYDKLIIDEGQDLIRRNYLAVMDLLLKGGLRNGLWQIYCDLKHQAIYSEQNRKEMLNMLNKEAEYAIYRLSKNCRNTKFIAEHALILSSAGHDAYSVSEIEGLPVDYCFYKDDREVIRKVEELLQKLVGQGVDRDSITLLSPNKLQNSALSGFSSAKFNLHDLTARNNKPSGDVGFCTIHSYKGLENRYIIITDIDDLKSQRIQELLYVGMTRAKVGLFVFIKAGQKRLWNEIMARRISN